MPDEPGIWVYDDRIRGHARMHIGTCPYCNDGKGFHYMVSGRDGGEWSGPFFSMDDAMDFATMLEKPIMHCRSCMADIDETTTEDRAQTSKSLII